MTYRFRIGITSDFLDAEGKIGVGDIGLGLLDAQPHIAYEFFTPHQPEITPEQIRDYDGIIALSPRITRASLAGSPRLAVIGRYGVGYDNVDAAACTDADVMLFITPDSVRRPVASTIIALLLALSLKMWPRFRRSMAGEGAELKHTLGTGLVGRTLGSVGIGNIGKEMFRLAAPFDMLHLAYDPYVRPEEVAPLRVELVDLETLLRVSDFVCINCPLTPGTRRLIAAPQLAMMKPTAYLINTARGGIVDTDALTAALCEGRLAGAGLDVTDPEPLPKGHALYTMDNVIITSHSLCRTDQMVAHQGRLDMEGMIAVSQGLAPPHVVNQDVLQRPGLLAKLERLKALCAGGPRQG